jgi:hypothetical protein
MPNAASADLAAFAESVARARPSGLTDLYLERVREVEWEVGPDGPLPRGALVRDGAAARRKGSLLSADGLDRRLLAELLDVQARDLAPLTLPTPPSPPGADALRAVFGDAPRALRWRAGWAAVIREGLAVEVSRPQLIEVTLPDGHRQLTVWPLPAPFTPAALPQRSGTPPRRGPGAILMTPPAAAVLLHELFGHPLEAEQLVRGCSPWAGRLGQRVAALPLDIDDDPTDITLPGSFTADDEGERAVRRALVREGTLVGALADRESAGALGMAAGNARRASCHTSPRPRLSNLVVGAPEHAPPLLDEAFLEVSSLWSGTVEPRSGTLLLAVRTAHTLRRGERVQPCGGFTLAASVEAACAGLLAAGGPPAPSAEPGWCGKNGEVVATGARNPWLLARGLEIR